MPFALAAVICWIVAFVLQLVGESLGKFSLLLLGLIFLGLHFLVGGGPLWRRTP